MAWIVLNQVMPPSMEPVVSLETPKLLQHITKSLVTIMGYGIVYLLLII
jgi:hypothetical protein